jgi:hypothetical protein
VGTVKPLLLSRNAAARVAERQTRQAQDLVGAIPWGFKSPLSHHISSEVPQTCATHPGSSPADKASVMKVSRMVFPLPSVGFSDCRIFGGRFGGQFFGFNERYRSQKKRRSCRPHRASILESGAGSDGKFLRKRTAGLVKTKSSGPIASDDRRRRSKAAKISGAYEQSTSRASLGLRLEPAEARHAATLQSYRLAAKVEPSKTNRDNFRRAPAGVKPHGVEVPIPPRNIFKESRDLIRP